MSIIENQTEDLSFGSLISHVENIHSLTNAYAKGAVNQLLTIRNWMIGYYIVEFEQNGSDRAKYGEHLLENLAKMLEIKGLERNQLNLCRIFYLRYPQICSTVSHKLSIIDNRSNFIPTSHQLRMRFHNILLS